MLFEVFGTWCAEHPWPRGYSERPMHIRGQAIGAPPRRFVHTLLVRASGGKGSEFATFAHQRLESVGSDESAFLQEEQQITSLDC